MNQLYAIGYKLTSFSIHGPPGLIVEIAWDITPSSCRLHPLLDCSRDIRGTYTETARDLR
jgi:hypothetical protein